MKFLQNAFGNDSIWQIATRKCHKQAILLEFKFGIGLAEIFICIVFIN